MVNPRNRSSFREVCIILPKRTPQLYTWSFVSSSKKTRPNQPRSARSVSLISQVIFTFQMFKDSNTSHFGNTRTVEGYKHEDQTVLSFPSEMRSNRIGRCFLRFATCSSAMGPPAPITHSLPTSTAVITTPTPTTMLPLSQEIDGGHRRRNRKGTTQAKKST